MAVRIVELDIVDWEPLQMRFVPSGVFSDREAVISHLQSWFADNAAATRPDCDIRSYKVLQSESPSIAAVGEHLTKKALRRLVNSIARRFPELAVVEIGEKIEGFPAGVIFDWVTLPDATVTLDREYSVLRFAISFTPVTIGQFVQFMDETDYTPMSDRIENHPGYLVDHFRLNFGNSPKLPLFGVTFDDASAYCDWAGVRLPSEPELHHFFVSMVQQGRTFRWSGECWSTTTYGDDMFVVRDGPYREGALGNPFDHYRKVLHRHHYQFLEAPCFRVARSLPCQAGAPF